MNGWRALVFVQFAACLFVARAAAAPPNFVVIFADDLGYGDLGCYGHPTIRTPQLDRMAAEGARFTQFYSAAPVCTPSRAALLTGRYPIRSGMAGVRERVLFPLSEHGLPDDELTIAEALAPLGYASACIGKWHLGHKPVDLPKRHGFDSYFGIPYSNDMGATSIGGKARGWPPLPLIRDEETIETEPDQRLLTERYTDEAEKFIRAAAGRKQPFFLYLPHTMPHVPIAASDRFVGQSLRGLYGDVVETLDWSVGRILATLRELGIERNTLVVFTSDNGPWLTQGPHGGSQGLLRNGKGSTWEGGMREPAIFWWPDHIAPRVVTDVASTLDLFPTIVLAAGGRLPDDRTLDGVDLAGLIVRGEALPARLFCYYRGAELYAARQGPWKVHFKTQLGYGQPKPDAHDPPLLFHLEHDPGESFNVAAANAAVIADINAAVEKHQATIEPRDPVY